MEFDSRLDETVFESSVIKSKYSYAVHRRQKILV